LTTLPPPFLEMSQSALSSCHISIRGDPPIFLFHTKLFYFREVVIFLSVLSSPFPLTPIRLLSEWSERLSSPQGTFPASRGKPRCLVVCLACLRVQTPLFPPLLFANVSSRSNYHPLPLKMIHLFFSLEQTGGHTCFRAIQIRLLLLRILFFSPLGFFFRGGVSSPFRIERK